jgi:predicted nucleic acid-binding protein
MLVLDAGGISRLARRTQDAAAAIIVFKREGLWPPVVPSIVLVESLTGRQQSDATVNRLLKTCDVVEQLPQQRARRAGQLRARARRGSAVDAVVVASAEPGGTVLSGDVADLRALAAYARDVTIERA